MKISEQLRAAALRIERDQDTYSCNAVTHADPDGPITYYTPAHLYYVGTMSPTGNGALRIRDFGFSDGNAKKGLKLSNHRVLALCMAATLAEEEGL